MSLTTARHWGQYATSKVKWQLSQILRQDMLYVGTTCLTHHFLIWLHTWLVAVVLVIFHGWMEVYVRKL